MNDPDVYAVNVELGLAQPLPWYVHYFQAADRANCRPWDLIEDYTPRTFWHLAALVMAGAEADHNAFSREQANRSKGQTLVTARR